MELLYLSRSSKLTEVESKDGLANQTRTGFHLAKTEPKSATGQLTQTMQRIRQKCRMGFPRGWRSAFTNAAGRGVSPVGRNHDVIGVQDV
jgi:hypothetical protein